MADCDLLCIGIGPKTIAVFAKAACIPSSRLQSLRILAVERNRVAGNWLPSGGLTTGALKLGTRPEKDLVYPMSGPLSFEAGLHEPDFLRRCQEFTWQSYLLARGAYSNWIDMGMPAPSHFEWSRYMAWGLQKAVRMRPDTLQTLHGEVHHIVDDGGVWEVSIRTGPQAHKTVRARNILLTGPGAQRPLSSDGAETLQNAAWSNIAELARQECVAVVGGGESACALVEELLSHADDRLQVFLVAPKGLRPRQQSYDENRYFSDARRNGWTRMTEAERRAFVLRADNGVCSPETYAVLTSDPRVTILGGKVGNIRWADHDRSRVCVEFEDREIPLLVSAAVNCAGFDHARVLAGLCAPSSPLGLRLQSGAPLDVDRHLRIKGDFPGLFLPKLGTITQGPGYTNLSCLGSLSDIVLGALLAPEGGPRSGDAVPEPHAYGAK